MWQVWHGKETLATATLVQDSLANVPVVSGRCNLKHNMWNFMRDNHIKKKLSSKCYRYKTTLIKLQPWPPFKHNLHGMFAWKLNTQYKSNDDKALEKL
jgi:hypothetical protein